MYKTSSYLRGPGSLVRLAVAVALCGALAPGASMCGQKTRVRQIETDRSISGFCLSGLVLSQRRLALSVSAGLSAIGVNAIC